MLNVTTEELANCEVLMTVEIDDQQKTRLLEKAARRISKEYRIPGFRPGKAPFRIIVNKFGIEAVQEAAMTELTEDVFRKALEEANITPFDQASLDDIQWEPLTMKVKIPVSPVVELGPYRDIRIEFEAPAVTDEDIAEELQRLRNRHATVETVERPAEMGDLVRASVTEKEAGSGEILSEQKDLPVTLVAPEEGDEGPDLSNIVGLAAGEAKTWTYTYPADYEDDRFAGKTVEITAEVHLVQKRELSELDDEFAGLIGDYDSLDQLKKSLKDNVRRTKQYQVDQGLMPQVLEQVMDQAQVVKWPAVLEEHEIDHAISHREQDLGRQGLDLQSFLKTQQKTMEEFRDELRESVRNSLKTTLVLNKVIELEKLQLAVDELRQQAELMTLLSGGNQQARQVFQSPAGLQVLANNLLYDKARERLLAIAKGETIVEETPVAETEDEINSESETAPASDAVSAEVTEDVSQAAEDSITAEEDAAENGEA